MNVGPDILRLLGASEEVIAAKEKEISHIKWEAPKVTGLEHSSAIANFDDVALSGGKGGQTSGETNRIFKTVGSYDGPSGIGHEPPPSDYQAPQGRDLTGPAVLKVKISQPPEAVPKDKVSKLPPAPETGSRDDSASDTSWDEESVIDGRAWWEDMSDEVCIYSLRAMLRILAFRGFAPPSSRYQQKRPVHTSSLRHHNQLHKTL